MTPTPEPVTEDGLIERVFMARADDCFQASLATLLGLPLSAVPRFDEEAIPGKNQNAMVRDWLKGIGFILEVWLADRRGFVPGLHIKCGDSPRGCSHAAVYDGDSLFHDPHPEGGGIIGEVEQALIIRPYIPRAAISALNTEPARSGELREAWADRDEWKQQHENLLGVKEADNAALTEARDKWMLLAHRALAYLPSTLGITRDIREAIDPDEIDRALARAEQRGVAALSKTNNEVRG